ncbi:DMSO/TMAO reductase YedYZ, molybdopterin-dependent catalytic subunit [Amycolatopsis xylanica]|uniref:DMSO/TMAO reductase YedYZ, molybdopterin-dependent catalytic subunit n=1 Tax=Amycolatopsis xylanica TaxID=589385 RepID=A0A1H3L1U0_9PSEU|nr:molybdopterin-dependent oxidoreductase [Amycolatopsis xylanica]SDY58392.1 DMSO/TMAO reductase YedYZ, molybdopterin-dependent catalytic subunit [Amycolatopsis xylanica]
MSELKTKTRLLPIPLGALAGVLAAVAALAAGHLVAAFVGLNASPYLAVGNAAIDLTPLPVKTWAVDTFGTADKAVLLTGMALVMLLAACLAGVLSRRKPLAGQIIVGLFGVAGIAAVMSRPDLGQLAILAPFVSVLVGVVVFTWLHRILLPQTYAEPVEGTTRRKFLITGAGVAVGAGVAGLAGQSIGASKDAEGSRATVGRLVAARTAPPIPADADFAKFGTPRFLTVAPEKFYKIDTALVVPQVRIEDWSLKIHGMVDREITFSYSDIRNRPLVERVVTLTCVSNEVGGDLISTGKFIGVDLADLLNEAGVKPGAEQLFSTSVDGWTAGTPVPIVLDPNRGAMLAIGMNDEPLTVEHGFPARLVVPGLYGYVSATKWVTDLELTTWAGRQAYWLKRGWGQFGPIKTESRIDSPSGFAQVGTGPLRVSGIAWAQHTGIERVEVRLNQGPWQQAMLSAEVTKDAWRMWWLDVDVPKGTHQLFVRATDQTGYTQTEARADVVPDGATGWHSVSLDAR